ncbi:DUF3093 family protein [Bryobacter aggregatus]|uniref:DUF3093 family protein n=1 Tax=Bryobacter aggregatus TaxID=360054 RepID=UPI0004E18929|nr:DUF3093 family protein [Bryobacter aggregatus]
MTRFAPSKHFVYMGLVAVLLGLMSAWVGWQWTPAIVPAALFFASALFLFWLSLHPVIEITDRELAIGRRVIPWSSITRIETTGWLTPLVLKLTVETGRKIVLLYAGDLESSGRLKEMVCNCAPHALLDGMPQGKRQATIVVRNGSTAEVEKHAILTLEDEAEVERMFQRLREVGHLDPTRTPEDR